MLVEKKGVQMGGEGRTRVERQGRGKQRNTNRGLIGTDNRGIN